MTTLKESNIIYMAHVGFGWVNKLFPFLVCWCFSSAWLIVDGITKGRIYRNCPKHSLLPNKTIHRMVWAGAFNVCFSAHLNPTGGFLLLQYSCGVLSQASDPHMSQYDVFIGCSSLLHYRLYLWFMFCPQWFIDELEDLRTDRPNMCLPLCKLRATVGIPLSPQ